VTIDADEQFLTVEDEARPGVAVEAQGVVHVEKAFVVARR